MSAVDRLLKLRPLLACCVGFGAILACAEQLDWLYETEHRVNGQGIQERERAITDGLRTVLTRVSGLRILPTDNPEVDEAFRNASVYSLETAYLRSEPNQLGIDEAATDPSTREFRLLVKFSPTAIQSLIRESDLPIWSSHRPRVLLIVSIVSDHNRLIIGGLTEHPIQQVIQRTAKARGIEVSQPLMDLPDRSRLKEGTVAFDLAQEWQLLRRRYATDIVSTARIDPRELGSFRVWLNESRLEDKAPQLFDADSDLAAAEELVHRIANSLAARYSVQSTEDTSLHLSVRGIHTGTAYLSLLDYLARWEFIENVLLSRIEGGIMEFELRTGSTWDQLSSYLQNDRFLLPDKTRVEYRTDVRAYVWRGSN